MLLQVWIIYHYDQVQTIYKEDKVVPLTNDRY